MEKWEIEMIGSISGGHECIKNIFCSSHHNGETYPLFHASFNNKKYLLKEF